MLSDNFSIFAGRHNTPKQKRHKNQDNLEEASLPLSFFACPNSDCADFNRFDADNLSIAEWMGKNKAIRRLYCKTCGTRFSERQGSLMQYTKLPQDDVVCNRQSQHIDILAIGRTKMKTVERVGVSLDKKLLCGFDRLIARQGYQSRSEAIRDLIRRQLSTERLSNPKAKAVAAVCLVYDHHSTKLMEKLTDLQHSHLLQTICSMHIHLDAHDCMEVIVLKGRVSEINKMGDNIVSLKGGKLGRINLVTAEPA